MIHQVFPSGQAQITEIKVEFIAENFMNIFLNLCKYNSGTKILWSLVNGMNVSLFLFLFFFCLFRASPRFMEVPRLGVQSELQLLAYATATATRDSSCVCNLHHSSQAVLDPLTHRARPRIKSTSSWIVGGWLLLSHKKFLCHF